MDHSVFGGRWAHILIGIFFGVGIGYFLFRIASPGGELFLEQREFTSKYHYVNPLLACGDSNFSHLSNHAINVLEDKTKTLLSEQQSKGLLSEGSIYFRELSGGGSWFGINEDALFTPGSLLKVPLILSLYFKAESDPNILNKKVLYEGGRPPAKEHFFSKEIEKNAVYTVEDLVRAVIVHSDNNAALLLVQLLNQQDLDASYGNLGIKIPVAGEDYSMTVRTYASFFKILYNATYLNREHSEKILNLLSQTTFDKGLVSGVPSDTIVSHKFGERAYENNSTVQLHDCGIIYKPGRPFLLCVMMRGTDFDILAKNIADIARLVFNSSE